jgi:hypothetical protein
MTLLMIVCPQAYLKNVIQQAHVYPYLASVCIALVQLWFQRVVVVVVVVVDIHSVSNLNREYKYEIFR